MTSIERTAYPRFGRLVSARELDGLAPLVEEAEWARVVSRSGEHVLSLVIALKCFQRLGYFPSAGQVPPAVIERVRGSLGLSEATGWRPPDRSGRRQQQLVRERLGVCSDPERARSLAEQAIRSEAEVKNHPPDLINVALEVLVREGLELPAFSTLDGIATRVRVDVNARADDQLALARRCVHVIDVRVGTVSPAANEHAEDFRVAAVAEDSPAICATTAIQPAAAGEFYPQPTIRYSAASIPRCHHSGVGL